ncbi:hypothetical protein G6O67_003283 [Ophiocordyceps sinensis]|uniref:Uncharacterized protein n=1 Tax=Ophiocordyceps sinensis TaxID=72228 RepID=A0A8H4V8D6_9HYPO|nr:hypothetical protein G6O67_003283 [Ophiocordyceps sinensis]
MDAVVAALAAPAPATPEAMAAVVATLAAAPAPATPQEMAAVAAALAAAPPGAIPVTSIPAILAAMAPPTRRERFVLGPVLSATAYLRNVSPQDVLCRALVVTFLFLLYYFIVMVAALTKKACVAL